MNGWLKTKAAAKYCGISERTVRTWIKDYGLKHSRVHGNILIKIQWIDEFLESYAVDGEQVDRIVAEVCKGL